MKTLTPDTTLGDLIQEMHLDGQVFSIQEIRVSDPSAPLYGRPVHMVFSVLVGRSKMTEHLTSRLMEVVREVVGASGAGPATSGPADQRTIDRSDSRMDDKHKVSFYGEPGSLVEAAPGNFSYGEPRPPLGVKPRWVADGQRMAELVGGTARYVDHGLFGPATADPGKLGQVLRWLEEMRGIVQRNAHEAESGVRNKAWGPDDA